MPNKNRGQNSHSRGGSSRRGFAAMSKSKQRKIASMGGRASHGGKSQNESEDNEQLSNDDDGPSYGRSI